PSRRTERRARPLPFRPSRGHRQALAPAGGRSPPGDRAPPSAMSTESVLALRYLFGYRGLRLFFGLRRSPGPGDVEMPLTKQQREILTYLQSYAEENGYAPSFDEIARQFNYNSLATVHEHLTNLERKG